VNLHRALPIIVLAWILGLHNAWAIQADSQPDDTSMTFWVRQAVLQDSRIGLSDITVDTSDGIVILVGSVPSVSARQYADREAKKIAGVRGVVNELFVAPSFRIDADITQDVRQRLSTSASISSDALRVTVHQGTVTLEGTVASWAERQEAGLLAGEVRGVRAVTNTLVVQYPHTRPDAAIQRDVATTLARDVYLTGLPIAATVQNGVVTLMGEVATVYQQERAGDAARLVWNVTGVNNDLLVTQRGSIGTRQKSPTPTDAQLTAAVYDTLAADQRLAPSEVTVHVQQGEVTLHGVVPSYYQKHLAEQAAHDVVGVAKVTNGLAVRTAPRDDADIQADVQLQLNMDALLAPGSLGVRSHNGIVTLTGNVNSDFVKLHVTAVTARLKGIRNILNNITVRSDWDTDAAIERRIKDFLASNAETQGVADQIRVTVNQAVVTLTGPVNFWSERAAAGEVAFKTAGVRRIDNQLVVMSTEAAQ
jgi:osmotically-inducible protein OsmY